MHKKRTGGVIIESAKQIMGMLSGIVKAKSMELKSKTRELKTRLIVFWLLKDKKVLLGSTHQLNPKLQTLLNQKRRSPSIEFPAVDQEKETKEEDEDAMAMIMMRMMMSKQGINLVQMHNNDTNHTSMPSDHITKSSIPVLATTTREEDDDLDHDLDQNEEEDEKDHDVVNVVVKDQPWNFVEGEGTTDDPYNHCTKNEEQDEEEDYNNNDDDDDDDGKNNVNIDEAADLFIRNFRHQLRLQKNHRSSFSS